MSEKLWGGRFSKGMDKLMEKFSESISYDFKLATVDITGSIAHAKMLGKCNIISQEDADKIVEGLSAILSDYKEGKIEFDTSLEDIHMNIESILTKRIGAVAGRLHTARSRNDQVATDIRLYLKEETKKIITAILNLQKVFISLAEENIDTIMPGFTHTQHAQPILLSHHLMAYFEMLDRDKSRFKDCIDRFNYLVLGSSALAGTTFPIDRDFVAKELGFFAPTQNSIDSVSDRDFISEFIACASICMTHLSRLAEEIILWNTSEFKWINLDDSVTSGSSIMPQKKNPDAAELVRGKTGRVYGDLMAILTLQKGLPQAYNRDLQEDKEPLFDAIETLSMCLDICSLMLSSATFNKEIMLSAAGESYSTATDIADYLTRGGLPFREAHRRVGELVKYCVSSHKEITDLSYDEIKSICGDVKEDVMNYLSVESSVNSRTVYGGTAKETVLKAINDAKARINNEQN